MWSPDGSRLLFAGPKGFQLFWQASDGSGAAELIADTARAPESWSAALGLVSYITLTGGTDYDMWAFSPDDRSNRAIVSKPSTAQMGSRFSLDGKWLAYQSNETGRHEIYVEPFPRTGTHEVSDAGGERPVWSPDGREIVYDSDATLYTASTPPRHSPRGACRVADQRIRAVHGPPALGPRARRHALPDDVPLTERARLRRAAPAPPMQIGTPRS